MEELTKGMVKRLKELQHCRKFLAKNRRDIIRQINLRNVVCWDGRAEGLGVVRRRVGQARVRKERLRNELNETVKMLKKTENNIKSHLLLLQLNRELREGGSAVDVQGGHWPI